MPEAVMLSLDAPELVNKYLQDVFDAVLNKDIKKRYDIRDEANFYRVLRFLLDNVGSFVSTRSIADALNATVGRGDTTISHHTVDTYISYLTDTYLLYKADRYDIKGKNLLKTQDKYYVVDLGFRAALVSGKVDADLGHKLENLVFLELRRRNIGDIWVGKADKTEIDFVVQNPRGEREYYQVAWTAHGTAILERELAPYAKIRDNYPKYLITTDLGNSTVEGVRKLNAVNWLLHEG
jgi:predicted AAA+ superfamily ATPase